MSGLQAGLYRVLDDQPSGCAFLQKSAAQLATALTLPGKGHSFESCKSQRRLRHLTALADTFIQSHASLALRASAQPDAPTHPERLLFAAQPAVRAAPADFHLYAGDGHFHAASSHDEPDARGVKKSHRPPLRL